MRRKSLPYVLALLPVALASAQTDATPKPAPIVTPFGTTTAATSLIPLDVKINGTGPYPFLLDTGAAINLITPELGAKLGIKPFTEVAVGADGRKRVKAGVALIASAEFGEGRITNSNCLLLALPNKLPFRGALGADVFNWWTPGTTARCC